MLPTSVSEVELRRTLVQNPTSCLDGRLLQRVNPNSHGMFDWKRNRANTTNFSSFRKRQEINRSKWVRRSWGERKDLRKKELSPVRLATGRVGEVIKSIRACDTEALREVCSTCLNYLSIPAS